MLQRPMTWVAENRLIAAGLALVLVAVVATVAILANRTPHVTSRLANPAETTSGSMHAGPSAGPLETAPTKSGPGTAQVSSGSTIRAGGGISQIPGLQSSPPPTSCRPQSVKQTGVTNKTITVGQIVTD